MKNISLAQAIGQLYFHSNSVCLFQGAHTLMYNHTSLKSWRHYRSSVALFLLDVAAWCSSAQCFTPGDYSYAIPADHKVYYSRVANTGGEMQGAFPKELWAFTSCLYFGFIWTILMTGFQFLYDCMIDRVLLLSSCLCCDDR